jgi:hypothetical protein
MVDRARVTRAQLAKALGGDAQIVRAFERLLSGASPLRVSDTDTAISAADRIVVMSDTGTATLPLAGDVVGAVYTIKRTGSAATVAAQTGETIDGAASVALGTAYDAITVVSTGVEWVTI